MNNVQAEHAQRPWWDDLRGIMLVVPLVAAATGIAWLVSRGLGATAEVSTAITGTIALAAGLILESQRRRGINFLRPSDEVPYWGAVSPLPVGSDLTGLLLDDIWRADAVSTLADTIVDKFEFEAIVWLGGRPDHAAFRAYPLHRAVEDVLGRSMKALFIDEVALDFDDMTIMSKLSDDAPVLLVQITANGRELALRANWHIENRTPARVPGYIALFQKPVKSRSG